MSYRIAKKGGQLIGATFADFETADNFIKHRPDSLPDATILLDCDDSYQWVGIQQALKELEELKSYSSDPQCIADTEPIYFAQQEIYVKEVEPLKSERDELAAELERVKAERDEIAKMSEDRRISLNSSVKLQAMLQEDADELDSLKSRLPVNADGDVPEKNAKNWVYNHQKNKPEPITVCRFMGIGDIWYFMNEDGDKLDAHLCHSTAESCRAANEKGENDAT